MNIGILFNCKENNFYPYLSWIEDFVSSLKISNLKISRVLVNDVSKFKASFPRLVSHLSGNVEEVLEKSDMVFSLGYWRILKKHQIEKVKSGIVNFHHSHNLKYKGRHSATWVIRNNELTHGSTMHFIDEKVDEGRIIDTNFFYVNPDDTAEMIFEKANQTGLEILISNFEDLVNGNYEVKSIENLDGKNFKFKKKDLNHEIRLNTLINEEQLYRELRSLAFDKKPSPFIMLCGKKVYLKLEEYDSGIMRKNEK